MKTRPQLIRGDLVKLTRKASSAHAIDPDKMFRVYNIGSTHKEWEKLGRPKPSDSSEGFWVVRVRDNQGNRFQFRRRELWRIPNQPRDKK